MSYFIVVLYSMASSGTISTNYPLPIGVILPYLSVKIPAGFLLCDGSTYNNTDYPDLAKCLDGLYGSTATTFTLPDLADGYFIGGTAVNTGTVVTGSGSGTFSATLTEANMPSLNLQSSGYTASGTCGQSVITTGGNVTCNNEGSSISQTFIPYQSSPATQPNYDVTLTGISARYVGTATPVTGTFNGDAEPEGYSFVYIIKATP